MTSSDYVIQHTETPCIISEELVQSTFKYQKIIIESEQMQVKNLKLLEEIESKKKKIWALKQEKVQATMHNKELFRQICKKRAKQAATSKILQELENLEMDIFRYIMEFVDSDTKFKIVEKIGAFGAARGEEGINLSEKNC